MATSWLRAAPSRPLAIVLAALACLALASPAAAAKRHVPRGFFGAVVDGPVQSANDPTLDAQMALMAQSGVESVRTLFDWASANPAPGQYSFAATDRMVRAAAAHGLQVLPIVLYTPKWASTNPSDARWAPKDPNTYAQYLTALIGRYGPSGSFWAQNPSLPRVPIRAWQIWNEPAANFFWKSQPFQNTYPPLLKAAYKAVHAADHGAKVVLGGLAGLSTGSTPWGQIKALYRHGAGNAFDVVAVHPFSNAASPADSVSRVLKIVRLTRNEMRRHRDAKVPIWLTELSWSSAKGRIPRKSYLGFETTPSGQAKRLSAMYRRLAGDRSLRIQRAFWYTWASYYVPQSIDGFATSFQYSGLMRFSGGAYRRTPLLSTYASVAARLEGCRKTADARRCR